MSTQPLRNKSSDGSCPPTNSTSKPSRTFQTGSANSDDELVWMIAAELATDPHELVEVVDNAFELFDACKAVSRKTGAPLPGLTKAAVGFFVFGNRKGAAYAAKQAAELYQACREQQDARAYLAKYAAQGLQQKLRRIRKPKWSFDRALLFITTQVRKERAEEYFRKFLNNRRGLKVKADATPSVEWIRLPDTDKDYDRAFEMFVRLQEGRVNDYRLIEMRKHFDAFWGNSTLK